MSQSRRPYSEEFPLLAEQILRGIEFGVPIDFELDRAAVVAGRNPTIKDPRQVRDLEAVIADDVAKLRKAGPFASHPMPNFFVSPVGAVQKADRYDALGVCTPGKTRVIHNLSYPFGGASVNAGVKDVYLPLSSFGHAARAVREAGAGCYLVKLDVEAAYKQVPVRPEDWHLLGFQWDGQFYYERVLPFGLRSSCRLWDMYAAALHHLFEHTIRVPMVIHYVDDFLFVVKQQERAQVCLEETLALCEYLGIPMAPKKTEGPTQSLTFLGIRIDTVSMMASLPDDKLLSLQRLLSDWGQKSSASIRELQSLTGQLNFACAVVRPGRFFLRRLINWTSFLLRTKRTRKKAYDLSAGLRADVEWWRSFIVQWNGQSLLYEQHWQEAKRIELFTDACNHGYGAVWKRAWFAGAWCPDEWAVAKRGGRRDEHRSMPFLELRALVLAAAAWGDQWRGRKVTFRCDCMPVVHAIAGRDSHSPEMMHHLRALCRLACDHGFDFRAEHIPGVENDAADFLSRSGDCAEFRAVCPRAFAQPVAVPAVALPPPRSAEEETPEPAELSSGMFTSPSARTPGAPTARQ